MENKYHKTKEQIGREAEQIKAAQLDPVHFQPLYEEYFNPIFKFIYRRTADEQLTADITSQVFLKALVNIKKFVPRTVPFSSWLYRIALNEVNMHFRKNKSSRTVSFEITQLNNIAQEGEIVQDAETEKIVLSAMAQLPDDSVQLIEMRFFEDRTFAEIADICGMSEAGAKMKTYRILEKLKQMISGKLNR